MFKLLGSLQNISISVGRLREMYPSLDGHYVGYKGARSRQGQGGGVVMEDSEDIDSGDLDIPKVLA